MVKQLQGMKTWADQQRAARQKSAQSTESKPLGACATFETLCVMDDRLAAAGHHPLLGWWREQLGTFYASSTALSFVGRVGRGGAKSNTSVKIGCNEILHGNFEVPPGEIHYWAQVSESKPEAAQRLRLYDSFFTALGVEHQTTTEEIIIPSLRRGVRVFACTIGAVSGFRCIGYAADEAAKWENRDHSANPAQEVIVSIEAMTVTHPGARSLIISSPWGIDDYHYELFERGTNENQITAQAPTWVANPSVTREQCLAKAKGDEKILEREYGAVPGGTVTSALDPIDLKQAFLTRLNSSGNGRVAIAIDASSLRGDAFAWLVAEECDDGIRVKLVEAIEGEGLREHTMGDVVDIVAKTATDNGARQIFGDQRESASLVSLFGDAGFGFTPFDWSNSSKDEAFQLLRRLLRERRLELCDHPKLRNEMRDVKARLAPSGLTTYATNGLDYLSALITLMHAVIAGDFRDSIGSSLAADLAATNFTVSNFNDSRYRGLG